MLRNILNSSSLFLNAAYGRGEEMPGDFVVFLVIFSIIFIAILIASITTIVRRIKHNDRHHRRPPPPPRYYCDGDPGGNDPNFFDMPSNTHARSIDPFDMGRHNESSYGEGSGTPNKKTYSNAHDASSDATRCPSCGAQIEGNEKFCPYCGRRFNK